MAKNHEKFTYFDVAIPRSNTLLLSYLQEVHVNTNIPEGQVLVQLATEYVKQLSSGQANTLTALGPLQAVMASMLSALPQQQAVVASTNGTAAVSSVQSPGAVQALGYDLLQNGAGADDLNSAFGDPD